MSTNQYSRETLSMIYGLELLGFRLVKQQQKQQQNNKQTFLT